MSAFRLVQEFPAHALADVLDEPRDRFFFSMYYRSPKMRSAFDMFVYRDVLPIAAAIVYTLNTLLTPFVTGATPFVNRVWPRVVSAVLALMLVAYVYLQRKEQTPTTARVKSWLNFMVVIWASNTTSFNVPSSMNACIDVGVRDDVGSLHEMVQFCGRQLHTFPVSTFFTLIPAVRLGPMMFTISAAFIVVGYGMGLLISEPIPSSVWSLQIFFMIIAFMTCIHLCFARNTVYQVQFEQAIDLAHVLRALMQQKNRVDGLLHSMLPPGLIRRLMEGESVRDVAESATVFFSDIQSFTHWSASKSAFEVSQMLHSVCVLLDSAAAACNVTKVLTVGDAYWAVSGLPEHNPTHALNVVQFGVRAIEIVETVAASRERWNDVAIRVGIHSGAVGGAIVGRTSLSYQLFGETNTVCEEVEQHGVAGVVVLSRTTRELLPDFAVELCRPYTAIHPSGAKQPLLLYFLAVTGSASAPTAALTDSSAGIPQSHSGSSFCSADFGAPSQGPSFSAPQIAPSSSSNFPASPFRGERVDRSKTSVVELSRVLSIAGDPGDWDHDAKPKEDVDSYDGNGGGRGSCDEGKRRDDHGVDNTAPLRHMLSMAAVDDHAAADRLEVTNLELSQRDNLMKLRILPTTSSPATADNFSSQGDSGAKVEQLAEQGGVVNFEDHVELACCGCTARFRDGNLSSSYLTFSRKQNTILLSAGRATAAVLELTVVAILWLELGFENVSILTVAILLLSSLFSFVSVFASLFLHFPIVEQCLFTLTWPAVILACRLVPNGIATNSVVYWGAIFGITLAMCSVGLRTVTIAAMFMIFIFAPVFAAMLRSTDIIPVWQLFFIAFGFMLFAAIQERMRLVHFVEHYYAQKALERTRLEAKAQQLLLRQMAPPHAIPELLDWFDRRMDVSRAVGHLVDDVCIAFFRLLDNAAMGEAHPQDRGSPLTSARLDVMKLMDFIVRVQVSVDAILQQEEQSVSKIKYVGDIVLLAGPFDRQLSSNVAGTALLSLAARLRAGSTIAGVTIVAGMHHGSVGSAIIGQSRVMFDIFGSAVNTASRVMSVGCSNPGDICVSADFARAVFSRNPQRVYECVGEADDLTGMSVSFPILKDRPGPRPQRRRRSTVQNPLIMSEMGCGGGLLSAEENPEVVECSLERGTMYQMKGIIGGLLCHRVRFNMGPT